MREVDRGGSPSRVFRVNLIWVRCEYVLEGKSLRFEEGKSILGQIATGILPLIHPQQFSIANETYRSARPALLDELLDVCQCQLEFLEPDLCVLIDGLQARFSDGEFLNPRELSAYV